MSLLQIARSASGEIHQRIETTHLSGRLLRGEVVREDYLRLLDSLAAIHSTVEAHLQEFPLQELCDPHFRRFELLQQDRGFLGRTQSRWEPTALVNWRSDAASLSSQSPWFWAGALYVLEGSRMGSRRLAKSVAFALGVPLAPGCGIDYHLAVFLDNGKTWQQFKDFLANAQLSFFEQEIFGHGVRITFQVLLDIFQELSAPALEPIGCVQFEKGRVDHEAVASETVG